jgi:S-adenosylmethionine hydrolase
MPPLITLTTDFGAQDAFVGTMKGVIWSICPGARIADLSHGVPPQDIRAGAQVLGRAAPYFPAGTVHVAVVDPGVGTARRPIALRLGSQYCVGPDNGIFTPLLLDSVERGGTAEFVALDNPAFWLPNVSHTFHGRDIFAPVGAHLANGVSLAELGTHISDLVWLPMPRPQRNGQGWVAHVTMIDRFGNLTLDLRAYQLPPDSRVLFRINGAEIQGMVDSYGQRSPGEVIALVDSADFVEIATVNGSAADDLKASVGDVVEVVLGPQ